MVFPWLYVGMTLIAGIAAVCYTVAASRPQALKNGDPYEGARSSPPKIKCTKCKDCVNIQSLTYDENSRPYHHQCLPKPEERKQENSTPRKENSTPRKENSTEGSNEPKICEKCGTNTGPNDFLWACHAAHKNCISNLKNDQKCPFCIASKIPSNN